MSDMSIEQIIEKLHEKERELEEYKNQSYYRKHYGRRCLTCANNSILVGANTGRCDSRNGVVRKIPNNKWYCEDWMEATK